jgi:hypothetical protein
LRAIRRAVVARVNLNVLLPVEAGVAEGDFEKFLHRMRLAGGDDVVVRLGLLKHEPHGLDVFLGKAPVALGVEVAEEDLVLPAQLDRGDGAGDLARDEGFAAPGGLVVEENPVAGVHPVGLAVVHRDPVGIDLRARIGTARVEGRRLRLRDFQHLAIHFGGGGLIEARLDADLADGLQQADGAGADDVRRVFGRVETHAHVALGGEVIDFVGLDFADEPREAAGIAEIAVVEEELVLGCVRIRVDVVEPVGVERARAADDAVDFVAFAEEQFREVGAVLAGDARDQRFFRHVWCAHDGPTPRDVARIESGARAKRRLTRARLTAHSSA